MAKILIIEDDVELAQLINRWLTSEHHLVETVPDGADGLSRLKAYDYDLVVLDWNLPKLTGPEILQEYRQGGGTAPVLMLTGKNTIVDIESGFKAGADDYLTKPFHARELTVRIAALLRRGPNYLGDVLKVGTLELDRGNYIVKRKGEEIQLLPKEFSLLEFLMRNQNRVFSSDMLLGKVWVNDSDATADALTSCMKRLRKKIDFEGEPPLIKTIHGVGYKLVSDI